MVQSIKAMGFDFHVKWEGCTSEWAYPVFQLLVELIRAKKQWAPAIFSTAILLGTNIPWVGQKKNLHGDTLYLCK